VPWSQGSVRAKRSVRSERTIGSQIGATDVGGEMAGTERSIGPQRTVGTEWAVRTGRTGLRRPRRPVRLRRRGLSRRGLSRPGLSGLGLRGAGLSGLGLRGPGLSGPYLSRGCLGGCRRTGLAGGSGRRSLGKRGDEQPYHPPGDEQAHGRRDPRKALLRGQHVSASVATWGCLVRSHSSHIRSSQSGR
jgi:hypothetical protein